MHRINNDHHLKTIWNSMSCMHKLSLHFRSSVPPYIILIYGNLAASESPCYSIFSSTLLGSLKKEKKTQSNNEVGVFVKYVNMHFDMLYSCKSLLCWTNIALCLRKFRYSRTFFSVTKPQKMSNFSTRIIHSKGREWK